MTQRCWGYQAIDVLRKTERQKDGKTKKTERQKDFANQRRRRYSGRVGSTWIKSGRGKLGASWGQSWVRSGQVGSSRGQVQKKNEQKEGKLGRATEGKTPRRKGLRRKGPSEGTRGVPSTTHRPPRPRRPAAPPPRLFLPLALSSCVCPPVPTCAHLCPPVPTCGQVVSVATDDLLDRMTGRATPRFRG